MRARNRKPARLCFTLWYDFHAGWSSLVARWAHNPKVGGSNPPPATIYKLCLPKKTQHDSGHLETTPFLTAFPLGLCCPQCQFHNSAVGFALGVHQSVAIDVHRGRDLSVPHELLLHTHKDLRKSLAMNGKCGEKLCQPTPLSPSDSGNRTLPSTTSVTVMSRGGVVVAARRSNVLGRCGGVGVRFTTARASSWTYRHLRAKAR